VNEIATARAALDRGDILMAYDVAMEVLARDPRDVEARFLTCVSLARGGAAERALEGLEVLYALMAGSNAVPPRLREDADALAARLAKDRALASAGPQRAELATKAADLYEVAANRHGGCYPSINAASLHLLAGDAPRARELAQRALVASEGEEDEYWRLATEAEGSLILGDTARVQRALGAIQETGLGDIAARARTRQQLRLVCESVDQDVQILDALVVPLVLHYCGHMSADDSIRPLVEDAIRGEHIALAFGSLARGADIIISEVLLEHGIELHVVLPFPLEDFERTSVQTESGQWTERYRRCLAAATSVVYASDSAFMSDAALMGYASQIAMGHAINRATFLGVEAEQLAVWDGSPGGGVAGTAHDVAAWRRAGRITRVIGVKSVASAPRPEAGLVHGTRPVYAILFADFRGFSLLRDEHYDEFVAGVLGPMGDVIDRFGPAVLYRNTWGDAIQLVTKDVTSAAHCALEIQETLARQGGASAERLGLRIAVHVGRVVPIMDPIRKTLAFWGRELTRTARIEPRTPEGEVYSTDAFAALLALEPESGCVCEYMGRVTTAKSFETIPMYRLRRRS